MILSLEEVDHIAELARLELSAEEKERYRAQLSAILAYAARLQQLDTAGIALTASALPALASLRDDSPAEGLSTRELLANAPDVEQNQYRVPPVLE